MTTGDGTLLVVNDLALVGDSIAGRAGNEAARIAIADLQRWETRHLNTRNTVVVGVLTAIVGYVLVTACFGLVSPC